MECRATLYAEYVILITSTKGVENVSFDYMETARKNPDTWIKRTDFTTRRINIYNQYMKLKSMDFGNLNTLVIKINNYDNFDIRPDSEIEWNTTACHV